MGSYETNYKRPFIKKQPRLSLFFSSVIIYENMEINLFKVSPGINGTGFYKKI